MNSSSAVVRLSAGLALGLGLLTGAVPEAGAEIRAAGKKGLFTKVNGKMSGTCRSGICKISGGTSAGKNLFQRFRRFDTRGKIKSVEFDAIGKKNLIVGVTSDQGSFIDKSIELNSSANLYWLSPGGIHLGQGASFINVPNLTLSTANTLRFGDRGFDVFRSNASELSGLTGQPLQGSLGLVVDPESDAAGGVSRAGIYLDGIDVSIDESLYVDAIDDALTVRSSTVSLDSSDAVGGSLTLTGESVDLGGTTRFSATGANGGGAIQVGGSWQNGDASVRQATKTTVGADVVIDASSTRVGDGGEIVVWSDIDHAESLTDVSGSLLSIGGVKGGNGGRIETSGLLLSLSSDLDVRAHALDGKPGLWLQDPYEYWVTREVALPLLRALELGSNVTISTGVYRSSAGNLVTQEAPNDIFLVFPFEKKMGSSDVTFTLEAGGDIYIRDDIISTSGSLGIAAKSKGSIIVSRDVELNSAGGDIVLWSNTDDVDSGDGEHYIHLDEGSRLTSSGGKIVLAGGSDLDRDGFPDGYAYVGTAVMPSHGASGGKFLQPGISLGSVWDQEGDLILIDSGGGDIVMRGRSGVPEDKADGFATQQELSIDSGTGFIEILGEQISPSGGVGLRFGGKEYPGGRFTANDDNPATPEESSVDEDTAEAVFQRVGDPSITTVATPDADAASTPSPAASYDTGSGASSESEVTTASGSSSSIPASLSADGVAVELNMETSFSMTSSNDDAPSSAVPAAATAGDGGGEASSVIATKSATTEDASDSSSDSSTETGVDTQETQADGNDGDGAEDGETDISGDGDDASDTSTADSDQPRSTADSDQPRSPAVVVTRVSIEQATRNLQNGDAVSTQRAIQGLNLPDLSGRSTPSVQSISGFLQRLRQQVANP